MLPLLWLLFVTNVFAADSPARSTTIKTTARSERLVVIHATNQLTKKPSFEINTEVPRHYLISFLLRSTLVVFVVLFGVTQRRGVKVCRLIVCGVPCGAASFSVPARPFLTTIDCCECRFFSPPFCFCFSFCFPLVCFVFVVFDSSGFKRRSAQHLRELGGD